MKPSARYAWLKQWMEQGGEREHADVLDTALVNAYVEATGAAATLCSIGAPRCPQLGRDLGAMYAAGVLTRSSVGMPAGDSSMGFPKWIYSYSLKTKSTKPR